MAAWGTKALITALFATAIIETARTSIDLYYGNEMTTMSQLERAGTTFFLSYIGAGVFGTTNAGLTALGGQGARGINLLSTMASGSGVSVASQGMADISRGQMSSFGDYANSAAWGASISAVTFGLFKGGGAVWNRFRGGGRTGGLNDSSKILIDNNILDIAIKHGKAGRNFFKSYKGRFVLDDTLYDEALKFAKKEGFNLNKLMKKYKIGRVLSSPEKFSEGVASFLGRKLKNDIRIIATARIHQMKLLTGDYGAFTGAYRAGVNVKFLQFGNKPEVIDNYNKIFGFLRLNNGKDKILEFFNNINRF